MLQKKNGVYNDVTTEPLQKEKKNTLNSTNLPINYPPLFPSDNISFLREIPCLNDL